MEIVGTALAEMTMPQISPLAGEPIERADAERLAGVLKALADPARAAIQDFTPFWEFVSGPAHAGAFGPNALDGTFGPKAEFVHAPPVANTSPADGYQHFGEVEIDGHSGDLTVYLRDRDGVSLWSTKLTAPRRG